jgi:hypothetical protein
MPIDLLVYAFVAIGFIAVIVRFIPRDARGTPRLPEIIDRSVGMWAIRSLLRRPHEPVDEVPETFEIIPTPEEVAYRIGVAGADRPVLRLRPTAVDGAAESPIAPGTGPQRVAPGGVDLIRARSRRNAGLALQRRLAAVLVALLATGVIVVVATAPAADERAVLGTSGPASATTDPFETQDLVDETTMPPTPATSAPAR